MSFLRASDGNVNEIPTLGRERVDARRGARRETVRAALRANHPWATRLTLRQTAALGVIREFLANGAAPSHAELAAALGITATGAACHIRALVRKGYIVQEAGAARGLRLVSR